ncbi:hypothetical protein PSTT_15847 [Puccinia striiformis]|nr:hypothetical protein PSTT_15847 [Puccinia striiformis]
MDETGTAGGVKANKTQITIALTCNTDGSERKASLLIGKAQQPCCFLEKDASDYNYEYAFNAKAWITGDIFQNWLKTWNAKLREEKQHILLLLDNFSGHQVPEDGVSNIQVEFFSPNLTSHVQPLDTGTITCFKSYFQKKAILQTITLFSEDAQEIIVKELFKINQLTTMKMAKKA